jgi:Type IV secretion system pilin
MKKYSLALFVLSILLLIIPSVIYAAPVCIDPAATGLVPCGVTKNPNGSLVCPCEIRHFFVMIQRIYGFAVLNITFPLVGLFIVIGGATMLISGGNPGMIDRGRKIIIYAVVGGILVFASWVIIDSVLKAIGYVPAGGGAWWQF